MKDYGGLTTGARSQKIGVIPREGVERISICIFYLTFRNVQVIPREGVESLRSDFTHAAAMDMRDPERGS